MKKVILFDFATAIILLFAILVGSDLAKDKKEVDTDTVVIEQPCVDTVDVLFGEVIEECK